MHQTGFQLQPTSFDGYSYWHNSVLTQNIAIVKCVGPNANVSAVGAEQQESKSTGYGII